MCVCVWVGVWWCSGEDDKCALMVFGLQCWAWDLAGGGPQFGNPSQCIQPRGGDGRKASWTGQAGLDRGPLLSSGSSCQALVFTAATATMKLELVHAISRWRPAGKQSFWTPRECSASLCVAFLSSLGLAGRWCARDGGTTGVKPGAAGETMGGRCIAVAVASLHLLQGFAGGQEE